MPGVTLTLAVASIGLLIGGVGIGGVLLPPALKYLGDMQLHAVIPACMFAYLVTGGIGSFIYARHGNIHWQTAFKLGGGSVAGAYLGAAVLPFIAPVVLETAIAALLLFSGVSALRERPSREEGDAPNNLALIGIGFVTGAGSTLVGTGGPMLLVPILIWCRMPIRGVIGLSQVIQIPIAVSATAGNFAHNQVDVGLALWLALLLGVGVALGAMLAHKLPMKFLHNAVAWLMLAVGVGVLWALLTPP